MRYKQLSDIADYGNSRVETSNLTIHNYVSTENMLPNKAGITVASGMSTTSTVPQYMPGDVLTSNIRPYFKKIWYADKTGGCSNDVLIVRAKEGICSGFLYYVLADDAFFDYSVSTSKGTKMPRGDKKAIMEYSVPDLGLDEQHAIAATLSCLDDKIELNNKINANLKAQAQAIFKSWFVDFEPFQGGEFVDSELGPIPKGWRVGLLSELINVKYGKDHKKLADGTIPVYGSGGIMRHAEKALYDKESVLIPRKGTLNNVIYINEPFWTVDTMFFSEMLKSHVAKYVYFFISGKDLASMNAGSAVPSMTTDILNSLPVIIAPDDVFHKFDSLVAPMFEAQNHNSVQSRTLAALRDTLLPKLMSGEIEVPVHA